MPDGVEESTSALQNWSDHFKCNYTDALLYMIALYPGFN